MQYSPYLNKIVDIFFNPVYNNLAITYVQMFYNFRKCRQMNKIERVTADVQVAEQLKKWIVDQRLEAGDRLPTEAELWNEFGVARHTLREGIKRLSQLGIVESKTGSGTYIRESSYDKVEEYLVFLKDRKEISKQEIYDVRAALESIAASAAARNAADADIRQMEKILNRMKRSVENGDNEKFLDTNVEFHNAVISLSRNRLLIGITQAIQNLIRYSMSASQSDFQKRMRASYQEHCQILQAIQEHDEVAAHDHMLQHILESSKNKK